MEYFFFCILAVVSPFSKGKSSVSAGLFIHGLDDTFRWFLQVLGLKSQESGDRGQISPSSLSTRVIQQSYVQNYVQEVQDGGGRVEDVHDGGGFVLLVQVGGDEVHNGGGRVEDVHDSGGFVLVVQVGGDEVHDGGVRLEETCGGLLGPVQTDSPQLPGLVRRDF